MPHKQGDALVSFRQAVKQGEQSLKQFVFEYFKDAGWMTREMLNGMMQSDDFYASEMVQVKPPSLYRGRFVMVGNAGYAAGFTGSNTTLAMTGAYILASEISKHQEDIMGAI